MYFSSIALLALFTTGLCAPVEKATGELAKIDSLSAESIHTSGIVVKDVIADQDERGQ